MVWGGSFGSIPDWLPLLEAARYLGVPPWELLAKPRYWRSWAETRMQADHIAEQQRELRAKAKAKTG